MFIIINCLIYLSGFYEDRDLNSEACTIASSKPHKHPVDLLLQDLAPKFGFPYLDISPIYSNRGDLHYGRVTKQYMDCTNYCHTPETVLPELALLTELLK